jgi:hypothetical protein
MHHTDPTAELVTVLRKVFLVVGFLLFLMLGITTGVIASRHHSMSGSSNLQPELQAAPKILK